MSQWIRQLDDPGLDLASAGGKGVNLGRLTRAGLRVPPGFVVTTDAYRRFVGHNRLDAVLGQELGWIDLDDPGALAGAADRIAAEFDRAPMPAEVAAAVEAAYRSLAGPVAVRSSATAEDLPDASFAGQQDTFLQVVGADAVGAAVRACWASLWTVRSMTYRQRQGTGHEHVALAAVVQQMVASEVSGVLFTADPLTGHRGRLVLDATEGLGEALVSGQVEPDHVVVDRASRRVLSYTVGSKAVATVADPTGGVRTLTRAEPSGRALTDAQVRAIVQDGLRIEGLYAAPQDIEWAIADGVLHLLQTRAITTLFPLPAEAPPASVWFSFGSVQGMLAPISPLGRDVIGCILSGAARVAGHEVDPADHRYLATAGERLWLRVDRALADPIGARILPAFLRFIDPGAAAVVERLRAEGLIAPAPGRARAVRGLRTARDLATLLRVAAPHAPAAWRRPERARDRFDATVEQVVAAARAAQIRAGAEPDPVCRTAARAAALRDSVLATFPAIAPWAGPMVAPPLLALRLISRLAGQATTGHGVSPDTLEVLRSVPRNPTTEMDLALWRVAESIMADPDSRAALESGEPADLAARYLAGALPAVAQDALGGFLAAYGMRGVGEIDIARPRWHDDPTDVLATLRSYLRLPAQQAPREIFRRGEVSAARAVSRLALAAGRRPRGVARAGLVRAAAPRIRALVGAREQPKFTAVRVFGVGRAALLASAADLVALGALDAADDIFFLHLAELCALTDADLPGLRGRVADRRAAARTEARRPRVPRVLVGDGRAIFDGLGHDGGPAGLTGSPVSPGVVEGRVRVVTDPARAGLEPGEILVCAGTDPAWTPLFLTAVALVTEVGGMMTHGSVVAREYGIPAVVGVHEATTRLHTGQRIRLDGSTGTILVLDDSVAD